MSLYIFLPLLLSIFSYLSFYLCLYLSLTIYPDSISLPILHCRPPCWCSTAITLHKGPAKNELAARAVILNYLFFTLLPIPFIKPIEKVLRNSILLYCTFRLRSDRLSLSIFFKKIGPTPISFCLFLFFSLTILKKNFRGFQTLIVEVEGDHVDHLTTTTAPQSCSFCHCQIRMRLTVRHP